MSATEPSSGVTESAPPVRIGLKLPPPEPPRFSLSFKIFFAAALLIFIGIGGAIAISTFQARRVADAKIASDLTKSGPAWESFQQNRYGELHRALGVVVSNPGLIGVMTLDPLSPATTIDTLKAEQASNARADFLLAADREGRVFARTDKPLGYVADLSRVPTIAGALQGESTQGIWLSGNKLYHVVAQPVLEGGSRVVGVIAAAFAINDEAARSRPADARGHHDGGSEPRGARGRPPEARRRRRGFPPGKDDRASCAERIGQHLPGLFPSCPLLDRPARGRRGRPAQPRRGAEGLPADPEHADRRRPGRARGRFRPLLRPRPSHHGPRGPPRPRDRGGPRGQPRIRRPAGRLARRDRHPGALLQGDDRGIEGEGRPGAVRQLADPERRRRRRDDRGHSRRAVRRGRRGRQGAGT